MIESPARSINAQVPDRKGQPRLIAVMPAYNEEATIVGVLDHLYPMVDRLLIVDDGSVDRTREAVFEWLADKPHAHLISFNKNRGMSAAYYEAFQHLGRMAAAGKISRDDVVLTVDADGQHDPASIELLLRPIAAGADAVIARRDFRLYPLYKRLGNWVMSAWASIWGGRRFRDVESGFRAFRVGALLDALRFYKGYKYSETVEIAVILPRLGYTVHDTTTVDIPVFRSRTRLKDVAIDLVAMPCAWWRVVSARQLPRGVPTWFAYWVLPLFFLAATAFVLRMLTRGIYLGDDTINNYVHVWYIADRLYAVGRVPLHVTGLDGGHAFTFPYGLTPWLANALVFPLFGSWSVTLFLVLGGLAAAAGALVVRPGLRDPWLLVPFLANPFFIDALGSGQESFLWATAGFFVFVWAVERRRWPLAAVALWFTGSTHPIEGGLAIAAFLLWRAARHPGDRVALVAISAVALPFLVPSIYFAVRTPAVHEASSGAIAWSVLQDLPRRGSVMAAPFLLTAAAPFIRRHYRPLGAALAAAGVPIVLLSGGALAGLPVVGYLSGQGSYAGLAIAAQNYYAGYLASPDFQAGRIYRLLSPNQKEQGAYFIIERGGVLANELFSESQARHSWTLGGYQCYLAVKHIDRVVVERGYHHQFRTNEQDLLSGLVERGEARLVYGGAGDHISVYDVTPFRDAIAAPASLQGCNGR